MLLKLLAGLAPRANKRFDSNAPTKSFAEIATMVDSGDSRGAIPLLEDLLARQPYNVDAISTLACCLEDIGDSHRAGALLEQACRLDDTHLAASLNLARHLSGSRRSKEAVERLRMARLFLPGHPSIDSALALVALNRGDATAAALLSGRAWLGLPDMLRAANCNLFHHAFSDMDEAQLASEHLFWAETLPSLPGLSEKDSQDARERTQLTLPPKPANKVRIAYWSGEFRDHSVRYFFRPLLENHDRERFEIVLYIDSPFADAQTDRIRQQADHFLDVCALTDTQLRALMISHDLDVLVELAGHTGSNRLRLLAERYARVQITALGYPPTTGLSSIDYKVVDGHIATAEATRFYTETPLVLPGSFWCFDPMEEFPIPPDPPATRNGFITFAVVGNIGKSNPRMFRAWSEILRQTPSARLMFRSIAFADPQSEEEYRKLLINSGLPPDRIDLVQPTRDGSELFGAYGSIDIILDTFPFNGGTTSCFAIDMGVPVVSMYGQSLISRMGLSILRNVGLDDWAVQSEEDYVRRAVRAAGDVDFLRRFRANVRERLRGSALGNGRIYARDFERAVEEALLEKANARPLRAHQVTPLPAEEILRRARRARLIGNRAFSSRMLNYCLKAHPKTTGARLLQADLLSDKKQFHEAAAARDAILGELTAAERREAMLSSAADMMTVADYEAAHRYLSAAGPASDFDREEALQAQLIGAALATLPATSARIAPEAMSPAPGDTPRFKALVPCSTQEEFDRVREELLRCTTGIEPQSVAIIRCDETLRIPAYIKAFDGEDAEILLFVQKNLSFANPRLFVDLARHLEGMDVLSFAGAKVDSPLDWRAAPRTHRAGSVIIGSTERDSPTSPACHLQVTGLLGPAPLVRGLTVLDGSFLALWRESGRGLGLAALDAVLEESAGLLEEFLSFEMAKAGARLGAYYGTGIVWRSDISLRDTHEFDARRQIAERLGIEVDPFTISDPDHFRVSVAVPSATHAFLAQQRLCAEPARPGK